MPETSKVLLRLPEELHSRVKALAARRSMSVNALLVDAIERGLSLAATDTVENRVVKKAREDFQDALIGVLLFGSRARGDAHDTSDTDLLIVVSSNVRIERSLYRSWDLSLPDNIVVHIAHLPTTAEGAGSLWLECALDARVLFDPSGMLRRRLMEIKEAILSGKYVRKMTHGQGFWVTT